MSRCSCITYESMAGGVPRAQALHMAAEFQAECPVHRGCEHRSGAGMCVNCQPAMFPSAEQMDAGRRWMAAWNEYSGNKHGATRQVGVPATDTGDSDVLDPLSFTAPAASPPEPDRAPWQELTPNQLVMLDTFASLAEDGVDEVHVDELTALFVESAAGIGLTSWTEAEVRAALADLQKLGYAGGGLDGETWAIGNRGRYVIEDYRRNRVLGVA